MNISNTDGPWIEPIIITKDYEIFNKINKCQIYFIKYYADFDNYYNENQ